MKLSDIPRKIITAFAKNGNKNPIPETTANAGIASYSDGFPVLTETPLTAGGQPPDRRDINGVLFDATNAAKWAASGAGYTFDSAFATGISGYPIGARILSADGGCYWLNTKEDNTTDPDTVTATTAATAGWVPDKSSGATTIAIASSSVSLTAPQYGKSTIILSGLLTANVSVVFPPIVGQWVVINNCTGSFSVTCKTTNDAGVVLFGTQVAYCDGTKIILETPDFNQSAQQAVAIAGGTADAITAVFTPAIGSLKNGLTILIRALLANTSTTPTLKVDSVVAITIVKGNNLPLVAGDIAGAGHWLELQYDAALSKWVLQNPAAGIGVTPPIFDNSTKVATTAYCVLNGANRAPWVVFSTLNGVLDPTACGRSIQLQYSTSTTIYLPLSASCRNGATINFVNTSTSAVITVQPQATNTLGPISSIKIFPGENLCVCAALAGVWIADGGSALVRYSAGLASSLGANGYKRIIDANSPVGYVLEQVFAVYCPANYVANTEIMFSYPIVFPTAFMAVTASNFGLPVATATTVRYVDLGSFGIKWGLSMASAGGLAAYIIAKGY